MTTLEELLSVSEILQVLGVSRQTLLSWIKSGRIVPIERQDGSYFYSKDVQVLFEEERQGRSKHCKRILVIEDDLLVGVSLKHLLERSGFEVEVATIGLAALDLVSREIFDLILADIRMPGMNGIEALRAIRALQAQFGRASVPEIILTAYDEPSVRDEAQRMGVREFILKPFEVDELIDAVKRNLKKEKTLHVVSRQKAGE